MAYQKGIIKLNDSVNKIDFQDLSTYKPIKDERELMLMDSSIQGHRINYAEYGRAIAASTLFREAFSIVIHRAKDSRMISRLTGLLMEVIRCDEMNARGLRSVTFGNFDKLLNFDFNLRNRFKDVFLRDLDFTFDRYSGYVSVKFPPIYALGDLKAPAEATHYRLSIAAGILDFSSPNYVCHYTFGSYVSLEELNADSQSLSLKLPINEHLPIILLVGIEFMQEINTKFYMIRQGSMNSLTIVAVDCVPAIVDADALKDYTYGTNT